MRLDPHRCPECDEVADRIVEEVIAVAGIEVQEDGTWDYDGNGSNVDWNSQKPSRPREGMVTLQCSEGHEWEAREIGDESAPGLEAETARPEGFSGGSTATDHAACLAVLDEFVSDIEAVEGGRRRSVARTWPDLWVTYRKARKLVRDDEELVKGEPMTLIHKEMAYYVVTVDRRSQIWKIDNSQGRAVYCRDILGSENPQDYLRTYRRATPEEHEEIAAAIRKVKPDAVVAP